MEANHRLTIQKQVIEQNLQSLKVENSSLEEKKSALYENYVQSLQKMKVSHNFFAQIYLCIAKI